MDQISPPFRIAIVALLAVCALWFTVLKPKDPAGAAAPLPVAPGQTGLGNAVSAAKGAAAASDAADAKVQKATGGAAATAPSAKAATTPARPKATAASRATAKAKPAMAADAAAPLLDALASRKAVVMLFFSRKGIDDMAVRKAVAATDRHRGRVVVKAVKIADVGRYDAITRGAQVLQAPTVLVIAPDRRARAIVGFTTTGELDQAIGDALRSAKRAP